MYEAGLEKAPSHGFQRASKQIPFTIAAGDRFRLRNAHPVIPPETVPDTEPARVRLACIRRQNFAQRRQDRRRCAALVRLADNHVPGANPPLDLRLPHDRAGENLAPLHPPVNRAARPGRHLRPRHAFSCDVPIAKTHLPRRVKDPRVGLETAGHKRNYGPVPLKAVHQPLRRLRVGHRFNAPDRLLQRFIGETVQRSASDGSPSRPRPGPEDDAISRAFNRAGTPVVRE